MILMKGMNESIKKKSKKEKHFSMQFTIFGN